LFLFGRKISEQRNKLLCSKSHGLLLILSTLSSRFTRQTKKTTDIMALQFSVRKGIVASSRIPVIGTSSPFLTNKRWQSSKDAGDVIGIDLGTTNSCVSIMVRTRKRLSKQL
jgi:hypothetical protein